MRMFNAPGSDMPMAPAGAPLRPQRPMPGPPGRFLGSLKKGGKVKKTGLYKLHKGERVMRAGGKMKLSDLAREQ